MQVQLIRYLEGNNSPGKTGVEEETTEETQGETIGVNDHIGIGVDDISPADRFRNKVGPRCEPPPENAGEEEEEEKDEDAPNVKTGDDANVNVELMLGYSNNVVELALASRSGRVTVDKSNGRDTLDVSVGREVGRTYPSSSEKNEDEDKDEDEDENEDEEVEWAMTLGRRVMLSNSAAKISIARFSMESAKSSNLDAVERLLGAVER